MIVDHSIERIALQSGPNGSKGPLEFVPASVNVFLGPNHSGKSLLLRELQAAIQNPDLAPYRKVLKEISFTPWSTDQKSRVLKGLSQMQAAAKPSLNIPGNIRFSDEHGGAEIHGVSLEMFLRDLQDLCDIGQANSEIRKLFLRGFFLMLGGAERLAVLNPTRRESPQGRYVFLLSMLFYSDVKRKVVQEIVHDAFKCHFVIDPLGENFEAKISKTALPACAERSLTD